MADGPRCADTQLHQPHLLLDIDARCPGLTVDDLEQQPPVRRVTLCASCGRDLENTPAKVCDKPELHVTPEQTPAEQTQPAMVPAGELDYYRDELLRAHRTIGALQVQLEALRDRLEAVTADRDELANLLRIERAT